jgi:biotin carboxyl carrier protein
VRYDIEVDGRLRRIAVERAGDGFAVDVDGRAWQVDAARVAADILSLLVRAVWPKSDSGGACCEAIISGDLPPGPGSVQIGPAVMAVTLDGRRRRKRLGARTGSGPQRIVAPMPGKVVRILVKPGESVRTRQPLVVVEAMKMENELRAGGDGTVTGIPAREGASVEAGALLIVI